MITVRAEFLLCLCYYYRGMANDNSSAITLAVVGILATCVTGLLWVIRFLFTKLLPIIDKNAASTEKLVQVTKQNTRQIKQADDYQRKRNGREAEAHQELIKAISEIPRQIVKTGAKSDTIIKEVIKNGDS